MHIYIFPIYTSDLQTTAVLWTLISIITSKWPVNVHVFEVVKVVKAGTVFKKKNAVDFGANLFWQLSYLC